jgi:glycosyltransferase involved in cell wall biosynthesis
MKVCLLPAPASFQVKEGGVCQVILALRKFLPELGIEIVENPEEADVVHCHATAWWKGKPVVYTNHGVLPGPHNMYWERNATESIRWNMVTAERATTVSNYSAGKLTSFRRQIAVIPNGVDTNYWFPEKPQGYALWGKVGAKSGVQREGCLVALELARQSPSVRFVFTDVVKGVPVPANVEVIGPQPFEKMREWISHAAVYLATSEENFSVQVLEAMACGVPVVGLNFGGTPEAVTDKMEGRLVSESELPDALIEVIRARDAYGYAARKRAKQFAWPAICKQYIEQYESALADAERDRSNDVDASIVITSYNKAPYLRQAVDSALAQDYGRQFEVVVVDDASTDGSRDILKTYGDRIVLVQHTVNRNVSAARNHGIARAFGRDIVCLDGDDVLHPDYLSRTVPVLDSNPIIGLVYPDFNWGVGGKRVQSGEWSFKRLLQGNYIGNAALFRKAAWERVGGYKEIHPSWEDYDLWVSIGEAGYNGQHIDGALWDYRVVGDGRNSQSQTEVARLRALVNAWHPSLYPPPKVSVIIPCYKQEKWLPEAIASIQAQTFQDWEIIVVMDDPKPKIPVKYLNGLHDPRIRWVFNEQNVGLAAARNIGVRNSRGEYILPLDADDKMGPDFLALAVPELDKGDGIIYCDFHAFDDQGADTLHELPEYNFETMLNRSGMMFASSLFPRRMWNEVGGYDESMKLGWEDYAFWIAAGAKGYHGRKVSGHHFWYRQHPGSMRLTANEKKFEIRAQLGAKFARLYQMYRGGDDMGCRGCGGRKAPQVFGIMAMSGGPGSVRVEYMGGKLGTVTVPGPVTRTQYLVNAGSKKLVWMDKVDAEVLCGRPDFRPYKGDAIPMQAIPAVAPNIAGMKSGGALPRVIADISLAAEEAVEDVVAEAIAKKKRGRPKRPA